MNNNQLHLETPAYAQAREKLLARLGRENPFHRVQFGGQEQTVMLLSADVLNNTDSGRRLVARVMGVEL